MTTTFQFTADNQKLFEEITGRYPDSQAALLPALHLVQEQAGYITPEAEAFVAESLDIPLLEVRDVVSFYSMFFTSPPGKHHIKVCASLSCWVCGSSGIAEHLRSRLGIEPGNVTDDGEVSWEIVPDCLGACELAPMIQVDGMNHGPLTLDLLDELLAEIYPGMDGAERGGLE